MESQASKAPLKTALDLTHAQRFLNQVVKEERSEYAKVLEGTTPEGSFSWMWSRSARILWLVVSAPLFIFYIKSEPPISLVYLLGSLSCVYNSIYRIGAVSPKLANRIADAFNILCWLLLLTLPASWAALFYSTEDRSRGFWLALSMVTLTLITSMRGILAEQSIGSRRLRGMRVRVAISLHIITVFVVGATALLIASEWASSSGVEPPLPLITLIITTVIASAALTIRRRRKVFALAVVAVDSLLGELAVYDRNSLRVRELILATLSLERALRAGVDVPWMWLRAPLETASYRKVLLNRVGQLCGFHLLPDEVYQDAWKVSLVHVYRDVLLGAEATDSLRDLIGELTRLRRLLASNADFAN